MDNKVFVIAEAGVNMNGNLDTALRMVDVAKGAGCDAWKGQCFWGFPKFQHLELTHDEFGKIKEHCDNINIEFMATPDTIEAVDFLAELNMQTWKVGSRNITDFLFLKAIAKLGSKIIISTGMSTLYEVKAAWYHVLASRNFAQLTPLIWVLHCVSEYPASMGEMNLLVISSWKEQFGFVGLSDHTLGIHIPIAAVAMGATVIEKHFTLDKTQEGPDHQMSLEPHELAEMVRCIRDVEVAMGDDVKQPTEYELKVRNRLRNYEDCG